MTDSMSRRTQHAREGYRFYSVSTPSHFIEYELPENMNDCENAVELDKWEALERTAEAHRTHVNSSHYRLG